MDNCNCENLKYKMLRDRLVMGIRHQELSKKLQLDPDSTLEKTKKTIRQKKLLENNTTSFKEMILRSLLWKKSDMESSTGSHPDQKSHHSMYKVTIIANA